MVLDKIFRFLDVFSVLGQEPDICKGGKVENCLHDTSTPESFDFSMFFFGFGQEPDICKGGVRWRTVCMIPAYCPRILFFPRFWPECSKIRCVQKPNAHRVPFCTQNEGVMDPFLRVMETLVADPFGCGLKAMVPLWEVNSPPILEPILVVGLVDVH